MEAKWNENTSNTDSKSEEESIDTTDEHNTNIHELNLLPSDDESLDIKEIYVSPRCEFLSFYNDIVHCHLPENEHVQLIK